jgi:hypothetical protein
LIVCPNRIRVFQQDARDNINLGQLMLKSIGIDGRGEGINLSCPLMALPSQNLSMLKVIEDLPPGIVPLRSSLVFIFLEISRYRKRFGSR